MRCHRIDYCAGNGALVATSIKSEFIQGDGIPHGSIRDPRRTVFRRLASFDCRSNYLWREISERRDHAIEARA